MYNHIIVEDKGKRSTTKVQYRIPVGDQGVRAESVGGYERIDKNKMPTVRNNMNSQFHL